MKNQRLLTLLATLFLVTALTGGAQAGWFDKQGKKDKNDKIHRYDIYPTMSFHVGTLRQDNYSGWRLDDTSLQFIGGAKVTGEGGSKAQLQEGDQVLVMGPKVGETILAWRAHIMAPDWNVTRNSSQDYQVTWSTSDPTVGEGPTTE